MKKKVIFLVVIMSVLVFMTSVFAVEATKGESGESIHEELEDRRGNASLTTIENLTTKEEKIAYYTEKCGNATNGTILYYLYEIQKYSIPVFFIFIVVASLNFFIIGNKKLDKREQGFSMLISSCIGLIIFQVLPLLFAILVVGR